MNNTITVHDNLSFDDLSFVETFIPDEIKEEAIIYENLRKAELKEHPKYLSIVKRLDEPVFVGDLSSGIKLFLTGDYTKVQLQDAIDDAFTYVVNNLEDKYKDRDLFINVSPDLFKIIKYIAFPMEISNIDLSLWKYKKWLLCEAPEVKDYMFNVYVLKDTE